MDLPVAAGDGFFDELMRGEPLKVSMLQDDVVAITLTANDGSDTYGLVHPDTGSWARVTPAAGAAADATALSATPPRPRPARDIRTSPKA